MNRLLVATVAAFGALASLPAAAQFQKPEDAIKYRQSAFTVMANHFGRIGAMAQGKLPFTAFGEGTDKGLPQRAKPEVWKESAKFKAAADKMIGEVAKLDAAAKSGSLDAIKAATGAVGQSCKACHDDFRAEKPL